MNKPLEGELAATPLSTKKPWFTPARKAGLIGVGTVVVLAFIFWKNPGGKKDDPETPAPPQGIGQSIVYDPPKPQPMPAAYSSQVIPPPVTQTPPPVQQTVLPPVQPLTKAAVTPTATTAPTRPPRMLSYASEATGNKTTGTGSSVGADGKDTGTRVTYKSAEIVGAKAGTALDKDLLLMPGIIRCILDTAIDSTLPGPLMCHLDAPVISSGNVVLMEKGTQIIGSYSNEIKQGQGRLMAVSATAYTPNGIPVPLGGPFADGLGRSGMAGNVDNHVMERFSGAVMLSLAEGAMGILQSSVSKGGNSYVSFSSGGVGSLAQEVLRSTINIPPTITKSQGDEVSIWVLTPIDFSSSYKLRSKG